MTLADVLAAVAGLVIVGSGFASLSVILSLVFPRAVARAGGRLETRPGRSILFGLLLFLAVLLAVGRLLKAGGGAHALAAVVLLGLLSLAVLGGAGIAALVGRRCRSMAACGSASIGDLLRGAFLLEGACLLPLVGWFVVLPAALFASIGAGLHTLVRRQALHAETAPAQP